MDLLILSITPTRVGENVGGDYGKRVEKKGGGGGGTRRCWFTGENNGVAVGPELLFAVRHHGQPTSHTPSHLSEGAGALTKKAAKGE